MQIHLALEVFPCSPNPYDVLLQGISIRHGVVGKNYFAGKKELQA
jgi:hypothetical protein